MTNSIGRMLSLFLVSHSVASVVGAPMPASSGRSNDTVVAKVGSHVTLRCPVQSEETHPVWTYNPPSYNPEEDEGDRELSACNEDHINRCVTIAIETGGTVSVLNITDILPEDAGQYKCQNIDSSDDATLPKELIVIDDGPKCSSSIHKDLDNKVSLAWNTMELHCEVGYSGSLNATGQCIVEWRIVGMEDVLDSKCIVGDSSVKSTLTLDAVSHSNATSYVCVVRGSAVEQYEQYSCQTGQIDTPLTTHEDVASLSTDLQVSTVSHLPVGQSTEPETVDDRTSVSDHLTQPPSTKQFEVVRPQVHDIPQQMSEIVQVQKELLVIEKERLGLEREKIAMIATMVASHSDEVKKEI